MNHQDWNPVNVGNTTLKKVEKEIVEKKKEINPNISKLDIDDIPKLKYVPKDICNLIIQARCAKKLTRDALAKQLNMRIDVLANIESGKAIYDGNTIAKIKKGLNIK
jgi:ribosome-binding protein aMBF1 (putative translation factor)